MRAEKLYLEDKYATVTKAGEDNHKIIPDLYQEYRFYKDKHARLAFLANNLIGDIPRSLRDVETVMVPLLKDVEDFLKLCRGMVDGIREEIHKRA